MKKLILAILLVLVPSVALGAEPFARATVEAGNGIVPGQQVRVDIDVYVPDFFTSPPHFPLFDLPNALVTLPAGRSENLTETVDGVRYTGIRKTYAVVPQVSGTFTMPQFGVELGHSSEGVPTKATVTIPPVSFTVGGSSEKQQQVAFAATDLTVEEAFDRDARSMKVGDALTRTITITAGNTQAMMIPPLDPGTVPGLNRYENAPAIQDGIAVGRDTASRRTETYVYTADKEGSFVIPAISYTWFDVSSHGSKSASLPAMTVNVAAATAASVAIKPVLEEAPRPLPHVNRQRIAILILALLALAALAWIGRKAFPVLRNRLRLAKERYHSSHGYRLKLLRHTIATGSEMEIYAHLAEWSRNLGYRTLGDWLREAPNELRSQIDILSAKLFKSAGGTIDRTKLATTVDFEKAATAIVENVLPPLNP
ncbi:protein BatD (plasmid) [Rhizobium grahamii]|uniref:Protein BatD n=1 Tax=Rhizobium grahamii TaxID=1120045 RepID=A0A5Q0CBC2_9HYPH|nr:MULTISPECIES: BatD family protein [Rhizobium]QFY63166.1 protein BatD [Rhizobium grahamii]QRM52072.1 protein BatD [Rhizobium sp. BG6]